MPTIFSKIIKGEIPSYKIAEDENFYSFLDINPLAEGHTLVIPKKEIDYYFDMNDDLIAGINVFSKRIARAMKKVIICERIGIAVIGLEIAHAHIHLVPINGIFDIDFSRPKLKFSDEEFREIQTKIQKVVE